MRKTAAPVKSGTTKKGYNEKNPGQPQGAFPPASGTLTPGKKDNKSNAADKKKKEDQQ
jgi:hypothetical protein